jgi:hypothetical protein
MFTAEQKLITVLALGISTLAMAAGSTAPTKEAREKMALAHEKMATCLRSERDVAECHREMKKSCKEHMGEHGCKMDAMDAHKHQ